jgi:transcriptional regulator with XRE-family HTH domain
MIGPTAGTLGDQLREWRSTRGMSQLDLALTADVSSRHISFVETGRSQPSREMVLRIAEALEMPLRGQNSLLLAAGYAPAFGERALDASDLAPVRKALGLVLASHEPYPAFVLDAAWNILLANRVHHALLDLHFPAGLPQPINAVRLLFDSDQLRDHVLNWELVAHVLGRRIRQQLSQPGLPEERRRQLHDLLAYPGVEQAIVENSAPPDSAILIPLDLEIAGSPMSFFSTLATFGTPLDVTLEELRIESLFPADEATEATLRAFDPLRE